MRKLHLVLLSTALLTAAAASAQTAYTYRWVDKASGLTVYSDQPPPPGTRNVTVLGSEERVNEQQLPYATRQAAEKFPVTLYTSASCVEGCKQARDLLNGRGVPFAEKMLKGDDDTAELAKKLGSEPVVPSLFVGQQNFKGFESGAWNNLLDLAGYPKSAPFGAKPSGVFAR
jgi:glutaredoxin